MDQKRAGLAGALTLCFSGLAITSAQAVGLLDAASAALKDAAAGGAGWWQLPLFAFVAGVLTSFLPCIYPMIPITVGILQAQRSQGLLHNFLLAFTYVLGIATIYSVLGYVSASSAILFGSWLAKPWLIGIIVLFFLYLAGSMFGFYELVTPSFLKQRDIGASRGGMLRCFILGMASATVTSPCLTPPLAIILGLVSKNGNPLLGVVALFAFSLGMGLLLLIIGTFSGSLALLPRAGQWFDEIKRLMGFAILAVCVNFSSSLLSRALALLAYAGICGAAAAWYFFAGYRSLHSRQVSGYLYLLIGLGAVVGAGVLVWHILYP